MSLPLNQVLCGDCCQLLKSIPDRSIDLIVTDPPYAIGFMGKNWDKQLPPKEAFQECFRVLKDGALSFVMSSPRQDVMWRMLKLLEDCGFEMRQSFISWVYASGFPKAADISKGIDMKFCREEFKKIYGRKPTKEEFKQAWKNYRKIIGKRPAFPDGTRGATNVSASQGSPVDYGKFGSFAEHGLVDVSEPASDLAKEWQGWKSITGLKPALECILMVNKPFTEKTIADQVLKSGTGAVNVDACRIPFQNQDDYDEATRPNCDGNAYPETPQHIYNRGLANHKGTSIPKGRFPANLLISDDALNDGTITGAGITGSGIARNKNREGYLPHNVYGERKVLQQDYDRRDVGSFCRYFDLDAWAKHHGFLNVPKASKSERNEGLEKLPLKKKSAETGDAHVINEICPYHHKTLCECGWRSKSVANFHPTVKPVKLMAYLIELGCQPKGIVLDPFCGSGSTLIAAQMLRRKWIGIEIDAEYCKIAKARVKEAMKDRSIEEFVE